MSTWIKMISDQDAGPALKDALNLARTPHGTVDNVMRVHSLRPSTMVGHVRLYRSVLHDSTNTVPEWFQEVIGSWVSWLNRCDYSWANHWSNARHLIADTEKADAIESAIKAEDPARVFSGRELDAMTYAGKLTRHPQRIIREDVEALSRSGWDDGEILEINQIVGYFNYVNRSINGLGISTDGDVVGYYSDDGD